MRKERLMNKGEFRTWINKAISENVVVLSFTKKDGSERVMTCSTKDGIIPTDKMPKGESKRPVSTDSHAVFDLEKQEWRSFRYADLNSVLYANASYNTKGEYNGLVD